MSRTDVPDADEVAARIAADERQAHDWAVVLSAAGVPCRVDRRADGWAVVVRAADSARAGEELLAYDADAPPSGRDAAEWGSTRAGLVMAAVLLAARPLTGYRTDPSPAFLAGAGRAGDIVTGQVWRAVTSLTLHADPTHLVGNVVATALLATGVCRLFGPGLGAFLILVAGTAGNLLNAFLRGAPHATVGASTAIFGAVGILAGAAVMRAQSPGRRPWVPLAAGLALLAFLGTGEHADLAAHLFGFFMGVALGLGTAVLLDAPPGRAVQRGLALGSAATLAVCWLLALATIPRR